MKTIRCIAIDDDPDDLDKLCGYINSVAFLELVGACRDAFEAAQILKERKVDAMFIDINMPGVNGIDFVASLSSPPLVVFVSAYAEYAVASYTVNAVDYVLKPYGLAEFHRAALRLVTGKGMATGKYRDSLTKSIFVKVDFRWVRVNIDDIIYIQSYGDYLKIFIVGHDNPILTNSNFASIVRMLPDNFIHVHRSYVVNMEQVSEVDRGRVKLTQNKEVSMGDVYKARVLEYIEKRSVSKVKRGDSSNENDC